MKNTTLYLLGIIITIIVGTYFYFSCCSYCGAIASQKEEPEKQVTPAPVAPKATSYPFALSDGDFAYSTEDNFNFNTSSPNYLEPVSENVRNGILPGLKNFMTDNDTKILNITGYYTSDEKNNSAFPNLGLARANSVKNYFVSQEIPSSQINTNGKLMDEMVADNDIYGGPVGYVIEEVSADAEDEIKALYDKITANPLILYFDTAEASINPSEEQRQKIADITHYLDKVENAKCQIIGYTDSQGSRKTNMRLGQDRADFTKAYLMKNGILDNRIQTDSKGPKDPIASNDTEEGRAKNRRTVITIK
ncbi:OmpA family protein [Zobellia sp. 1_MG-2023]|uniref:OmpA family protein n=1 Tax=Zobellia sp. 1_MG-2023 TaxID=3062626 RepID=UPI0026E3C850|nr:OmpA family protein [Zobellia sp. 1_MG-2023]MDO6817928.1 OmpA family protein [Zobellia sp. 1_MG-2023]